MFLLSLTSLKVFVRKVIKCNTVHYFDEVMKVVTLFTTCNLLHSTFPHGDNEDAFSNI